MEPHNLQDIKSIIFICILSFVVEYYKINFNLSIFNIFFFLNFIGIYYMLKKIRISIHIDYNI